MQKSEHARGERADRVRAAYIKGGASEVLRVLAEIEGEAESGLLGGDVSVTKPVVYQVGARSEERLDVPRAHGLDDPGLLRR